MTREEFEKSPTEYHPIDLMPYKPNADPNCKTCNGMGIIDTGEYFGCILDICPNCYKENNK